MAFKGASDMIDMCAEPESIVINHYVVDKRYFVTMIVLAAYVYLLQSVLAYQVVTRMFRRSRPPYNTSAFKTLVAVLFGVFILATMMGLIFKQIALHVYRSLRLVTRRVMSDHVTQQRRNEEDEQLDLQYDL